MRRWAVVLGIVALATAGVAVGLALRRNAASGAEDVTQLIDGCFERLRDLESELHRLRPSQEPAG